MNTTPSHPRFPGLPTHPEWDDSGHPDQPNLTPDAKANHPELVADLCELRRVSGWNCGTVAQLLNEHQPDQAQTRLSYLTRLWAAQ